MEIMEIIVFIINLIVTIVITFLFLMIGKLKNEVEIERCNSILKDFKYIEEQYIKVMEYANEQPLKGLTIREMIDKIKEVKVRVKVDTRKKEGIKYRLSNYIPPKF